MHNRRTGVQLTGGKADRRSKQVTPVRVAGILVLVAILLPAFSPSRLTAQYPDAWVLPRGTLRVGFEPLYISAGERFDTTGNREPLGTDFSDDSAGVRLIPTLYNPQSAIWSITSDSSLGINAGAFRTAIQADVRRLPLSFAVGLTDRLTVTALVPFVTTRSQVVLQVDSTDTDLGWNQAAPDAANSSAAVGQIQALLSELEAAALFVEGQIAGGGYDCPGGPVCVQAQSAVDRARQMQIDITLLSGVDASGAGTWLPPWAPISTSASGTAVTAAIATLVADLQALGSPGITSTLPLPDAPITRADIDPLMIDPTYGYSASGIALTKYSNRIGDIEVGARFAFAQNDKLRGVLVGNIRLPTGQRDRPDNYTDIGSGDKQTDIEVKLESVWMPSSFLGVAIDASYTLQMGDRLERRVMPYYRPYATLATQTTVQRNLGDMVRLGIYPSIRLSSGLSAYLSASYFYKLADSFTLMGALDVPPSLGGPVSAADLEENTKMQAVLFGGGLYYRMDRGQHEVKLPIEAGIDYRTAFSGSGGRTPKATSVNFFLRIYWRLWGGPPVAEEEEQ